MSWSWLLATDNISAKQKRHLEFILNSWECKFTQMVLETSTLDNVYVLVTTIGTKNIKTNKSLLSSGASFAKLLPCANAKVKSTEALGGQSCTVCLFHTPNNYGKSPFLMGKSTINHHYIYRNMGKHWKEHGHLPNFTKTCFFFLTNTFSQGIPFFVGDFTIWDGDHQDPPIETSHLWEGTATITSACFGYIPGIYHRESWESANFHWRNLGPQPSRSLSLHQDSCWQHIVFQQTAINQASRKLFIKAYFMINKRAWLGNDPFCKIIYHITYGIIWVHLYGGFSS